MLSGVGDNAGVFRRAVELVLPGVCAGCGELGAACCEACAGVFGSPSVVGCVPGAFALARYRGVPRRLVLAYKERGRRDLAPVLGAALARAVPFLPGELTGPDGVWWFVPAPSARAVSRLRGGPHVVRLARRCAGVLAGAGYRAAVAPALVTAAGVRDAVGLARAERAANLEGGVEVDVRGLPAPGTRVVLVDDVITTGATAAVCTSALESAGCRVAAVLALTSAA